MLKDIKLIATDLDGTVLEAGELANTQDIETFKEVQARGIQTTIVTGQDWSSARWIAKDFLIDQNLDYMICNNGAYVTPVSEYDPIYMMDIKQEIVQKIYDYCGQENFCWIAFYREGQHLYWNGIKLTAQSLLERKWPEKFIWKDISQKKNFQYDHVFQMMIFIPKEQTSSFEKWYRETKLDQDLLMMPNYNTESMPFYEFINRDANKGTALINLAKHLNLKLDQIVCFGDNLNDLEMMEKIPHSVAMKNAVAAVKKVARYETDTNLNAGVTKFIKTEILGEK